VKTTIRQRALALGFDECRFATAAPPETAAHFLNWIASGHHGEMHYLARQTERRLHPQRVLPDAKTVICLAASHPHADALETNASGRQAQGQQGLVARYAQSQDYHEVFAGPLRELAAFVEALGGPNCHTRVYADTGPILERDFAQRAGVGFIGKHTHLVSRHHGNWLLLAELLTTLPLEPDPPERNRCGSCRRCLEACPTGALFAPFELDARRCVSYLTIELKGPIPRELRPAIGNRIFGCDDCLAICPWNRFAHAGRLLSQVARTDLARPQLEELLALDDAGFRRRFAHTPLVRSKRRGLLRNVCVALGNAGDPRALPALRRAASDPEPLIAEHARWAIDRLTSSPHSPPPSESQSSS